MTLSFSMSSRGWTLLAVLVPLLLLFAWVAFRSGPLAPVNVTIAQVEERSIAPAMFGIGTVEARYTQKIGPTAAGRVTMVAVDVGDTVVAGQLLAQIERFTGLGVPVLAGLSRKRSIGEITGRDEPAQRVFGSVAAHLIAVQRGASIVRVHDVAATVDALKVWNAVAAVVLPRNTSASTARARRAPCVRSTSQTSRSQAARRRARSTVASPSTSSGVTSRCREPSWRADRVCSAAQCRPSSAS